MPSSSPSSETRSSPAALIALKTMNGDDEGERRRSTALPQIWAQSCLTAAAPEEALDVAVLAGGEQADGPRAPDAAHAVDGDGADRVVDAEVLDEVDAEHDEHAGDGADDHRAGRVDPVARRGDGDEAAEEAVDRDADVPLLEPWVDVEHRGQPAGRGGQGGVGGHPADAVGVERRQRAAGVEPVPAEPQDDAAEGGEVEVVARRHAAAVALELAAEAGPEDDRAGEGDHAAHRVDDGRAGEVTEEHAVAAASCSQPPGPQTQWPRIG